MVNQCVRGRERRSATSALRVCRGGAKRIPLGQPSEARLLARSCSFDTFLQTEAPDLSIWRKPAQPASSRSKAVDSTAAHRFQTGRCHGDAKLVHLGLRIPGFRQARQVMSQWCRLFESCRKEDK